MSATSDYVIELSELDLARKHDFPELMEAVRNRRARLGEALDAAGDAFHGELFAAPAQAFAAAVDALQDHQTETIRRLEMGAEGLGLVVQRHRELNAWATGEMRAYERALRHDLDHY
jgi:hypothetical protein